MNLNSKKEILKRVLKKTGLGILAGTGTGYMMISGHDWLRQTGNAVNPLNYAGPPGREITRNYLRGFKKKHIPFAMGLAGGAFAGGRAVAAEIDDARKNRAKKKSGEEEG